MMLKNSFWAKLGENNKRRIWIWIVSFLCWFFYYPVGMALLMSRKHNHNLLDGLTGDLAAKRLETAAGGWLSPQNGVTVLVCIMAVACAVQGFSYLYSRKKVDLYHSMPVKKSGRFAVIFANGVLIYAVPYIINTLLALVVAGICGGMNADNFKLVLVSTVINFIIYMGTYGLTIVAVMLTGNLVITLFATGVLLFYEVIFRFVIYEAQSEFFEYYSYNNMQNVNPLLSPMGQWVRLMQEMKTGTDLGNAIEAQPMAMVLLVLMAVLFPVLAYICYKIRPSEAAGRTMAFGKTKFAVKFLIVVPASATVGWMVRETTGPKNSAALVIFGMAAAVVIGSCVMEVIYEMDIKAALKKKYQILISGVAAAFIYCIFCFDLFGFDAWIPEADKLESAAVIIRTDAYGRNYMDDDFKNISAMEYFLSKKGITDKEAIIEFSGKKADTANLSPEESILWCSVAYKMKNGKTVWRDFPVSIDEKEILNRIIGNQEYKATVCQLFDDTFFENLQKNIKEITFDSGYLVENLPPEDIAMIRRLYLEDMKQADYSTYADEFVCGVLNFSIVAVQDGYKSTENFEYDIYPSYINTIQYLREKGIYRERALEAEEVTGITVTNKHNELIQQVLENSSFEEESIGYAYGNDFSVTKTFTDRAQIEELLDAMYPQEFVRGWKGQNVISDNYYVTVQYKDGSVTSSHYRGEKRALLITDKIPLWLESETAYE